MVLPLFKHPSRGLISPCILLFNTCKSKHLSSALFLRYDSSKPVFLKTNWFISNTDYILIESDKNPKLLTTLTRLVDIGYCGFELSLDEPRLYHVLFGSRSNLLFGEDYHIFLAKFLLVGRV